VLHRRLQSFPAKVGAVLLTFVVGLISLYAFLDYREVKGQSQRAAVVQATELTVLLSEAVADDLHYARFFELWRRAKRISERYSAAGLVPGAPFVLQEIAIVDASGNVAGHNDPITHPLGQPYSGPLPIAAILSRTLGGEQATVLVRHTDGVSGFRAYAPVGFAGEVIGAVAVDFDTSPLEASQREHLSRYALFTPIAVLISALLAVALVRWITRPLTEVVAVLPALGEGRLALPRLAQRADEYGALGRAVEAADGRLHQAAEQLRSHRDELERAVAQRTEALSRSNRELEAFSYSVSHDLRAPLRAIDGFSQALLEDYGERLDESAKGYLQRVRASSQRMGRIIDDLLQLSRVTRRDVTFQWVDLSALAEGVVAQLRESEPDRQVEVSIASQRGVYGDEGLLRVLLENLLGNAWKYTAKTPLARIEFAVVEAEGVQEIVIKDNGAGFDMRYADKLFASFQRLHDARDFPGTGIGLATARRIVERHNGRIWAEAEPGRGACFHVVLPRADSAGGNIALTERVARPAVAVVEGEIHAK
jgi:signal transduction histidine kinase